MRKNTDIGMFVRQVIDLVKLMCRMLQEAFFSLIL